MRFARPRSISRSRGQEDRHDVARTGDTVNRADRRYNEPDPERRMPKKRNGKKPKIGSGGGVATAMAISEADVLELRVEATRRAARAAGMNTELMTFEEIREALPGYNGEVGRALERFLTAYQAWFDFHASVSDRPGQLRDAEKTELVRLIREKEEARTDFVALVELPASQ